MTRGGASVASRSRDSVAVGERTGTGTVASETRLDNEVVRPPPALRSRKRLRAAAS